ncbi:hypothetical protein PVA17_04670 [Lysinibacillus sp. CNPSo 3705]|uniref:hypothetical protein n=1 Tax=Lysinibacillus sp. CNPSo 3705 TaxID=3028148 RepID=UPI0023636810|nr:hypothetical protein [Lysinibacillus sp. CNPSo 3705]MDD1502063.1 hypothetical protein [Lysinibacillus sp. CNPSo 3705]
MDRTVKMMDREAKIVDRTVKMMDRGKEPPKRRKERPQRWIEQPKSWIEPSKRRKEVKMMKWLIGIKAGRLLVAHQTPPEIARPNGNQTLDLTVIGILLT